MSRKHHAQHVKDFYVHRAKTGNPKNRPRDLFRLWEKTHKLRT